MTKISCFFFQKAVNHHPIKMPPHIRASSETRAAINPQEMDEQLQRLRDRLGGGLIPSRTPLRVHQSTSVVSGSFLCEYDDQEDSVFGIRSWIRIRIDLSARKIELRGGGGCWQKSLPPHPSPKHKPHTLAVLCRH